MSSVSLLIIVLSILSYAALGWGRVTVQCLDNDEKPVDWSVEYVSQLVFFYNFTTFL